jgi:hypothetical protein
VPRTFVPTKDQITKAFSVTCPVCGVEPGKHCRSGNYQIKVHPPHAKRVRAAEGES